MAAIVAAGIGGAVPSFRGQQPGGMLRCGASPTLEGLIPAPTRCTMPNLQPALEN